MKLYSLISVFASGALALSLIACKDQKTKETLKPTNGASYPNSLDDFEKATEALETMRKIERTRVEIIQYLDLPEDTSSDNAFKALQESIRVDGVQIYNLPEDTSYEVVRDLMNADQPLFAPVLEPPGK